MAFEAALSYDMTVTIAVNLQLHPAKFSEFAKSIAVEALDFDAPIAFTYRPNKDLSPPIKNVHTGTVGGRTL